MNMTQKKNKKTLGQEIWELLLLLLVVLMVRTLLFQPFVIPSGSMYPTLMVGDYLVVNKYQYGYSKYSILLGKYLPDFGRIWATAPTRGDVIVFRETKTSGLDYIKRLIGMPGDTVQVKRGRLYINDKIVPRERLEDEMYNGKMVAVYKETLPNGTSHRIYETAGDQGQLDNTGVYTVPAGHYFMMGDNRDESGDSRCMGYLCGNMVVGYIPADVLIGPARVVLASFEERLFPEGFSKPWKIQPIKWITNPRSERFFMDIK